MIRRNFISIAVSVLTMVPFLGTCAGEDERTYEAEFSAPVSRDQMVGLWAELLQGYEKALSPGKAWGRILPDETPTWRTAPKSIKGDPELISRMMWSIAGWMQQPNRETQLMASKGAVDVKSLLLDSISHATDPQHPEYWNLKFGGKSKKSNQFSVESPAMGLGALAARANFKNDLPPNFVSNVSEWLRLPATGTRRNNWKLFHALAAMTRSHLGGEINEVHLRNNLEGIMNMYLGDGMFTDGKGRKFDDYNYWVFATHLGVWWDMDRERFPDLAKKIPGILRAVTAHQPYTFGADGSHPEFGRSITYKFARLASLIQAYRLGCSDVKAGMLRRIVRLHINHYIQNGAIDLENQRILQTLSADGTGYIREGYNYPGSTYWCMQTFGEMWRLKGDDSFWTDKEELLPVELADFRYHQKIPGWMFLGTKATGSVIHFNYGSDGSTYYGSKYKKQLYHSQLGSVMAKAGFAPCDNVVALKLGKVTHAPTLRKWSEESGEVFHKAMNFGKTLPGLKVTHILLPVGESLVRLTKVETPEAVPAGAALDLGGYALGYSDSEIPVLATKDGLMQTSSPRHQSILGQLGGDKAEPRMLPKGYVATNDCHTIEKNFVQPYHRIELEAGTTKVFAQAVYGSMQKVDTEKWLARFSVENFNAEGGSISIDSKIRRVSFINQ